jgi:hypothetical protein
VAEGFVNILGNLVRTLVKQVMLGIGPRRSEWLVIDLGNVHFTVSCETT